MFDLTVKQKLIIALLITISGGGIFIFTLASAIVVSSDEEANTADSIPIEASPESEAMLVGPVELPARLLIPALSIDATVQETGVTKNGAMGVPTNYKDVAWYKLGPIPGQQGGAVINGHLDNGLALAAVFKKLDTLAPGDSVYIVTQEGTRLHFVVDKLQSYPYETIPMGEILHDKSSARLVLITCSGSWLKSAKTYDARLAVYTHYVGVEETQNGN